MTSVSLNMNAVEHGYRVPVHGARRRRARILIGVVAGARDYRGRGALHVRATHPEVPGRVAMV